MLLIYFICSVFAEDSDGRIIGGEIAANKGKILKIGNEPF